MKEFYKEVREWLDYVRNYKENKDNDDISVAVIRDLNLQIEKLKKDNKQTTYIGKEKDELIKKLDLRIAALNNKLSSYAKRNNELRSVVEKQYKQIVDLEEQVKKKESARRKNASAIGGCNKKINELKDQLEKANYTIEYYRKSKKPTLEEIKAYELGHREVEKRLNGKSNNNI